MTAKERKAKVYHADLWGSRKHKYEWLQERDIDNTLWTKIAPRSSFYLFRLEDKSTLEHYHSFVRVTDIFQIYSTGITTHRDSLVVDFQRDGLKRRILQFVDQGLPDEVVRKAFKLRDNPTWKLPEKRRLIKNDPYWEEKLVKVLYRPFDTRWLIYHSQLVERSREETMQHMLAGKNLALCIMRQVSLQEPFSHALVSRFIIDNRTFVSSKGTTKMVPLYLYSSNRHTRLVDKSKETLTRKSNANPSLVLQIEEIHKSGLSPEGLFQYVYAVLYAEPYRDKYAGFLEIDFPRIPFTKDVKLFKKLAELGKQLVDLHLLRSSELDPPIARFQGEGDNRVQTGKKGLRYNAEKQRVYINQAQFFEGVPPAVWEYHIGGYQVCRKWLKDRRDRCLTLEEIKTYCRIATALSKTIDIQAEIDTLYPQVEKTLLPIHLESE